MMMRASVVLRVGPCVVGDVDGARVGGVLLQAGPVHSPALLRWGSDTPGGSHPVRRPGLAWRRCHDPCCSTHPAHPRRGLSLSLESKKTPVFKSFFNKPDVKREKNKTRFQLKPTLNPGFHLSSAPALVCL